MEFKDMTFEVFLKNKFINQEDFDKLDETKQSRLHSEFAQKCIELFSEKMESNKGLTLDEITETLKKLPEVIEISELKKELQEAHEEISRIKEKGNSSKEVKTMAQELRERKEDIEKMLKGDRGSVEMHVTNKALVALPTVQNSQQAFDISEIGQLATRKIRLQDIFTKFSISDQANINGTIRYYDWDQATIARAAAFRAEGAAFPESTASWIHRNIPIQKVGDSITITEEFMEDEEMFAAELGFFLETNVKLAEEQSIYNGNGTPPNLKGITASIGIYDATPQADTIPDASIYDLIVKVSESITQGGGAKYMPNVALMNIQDINRMKLKKDAHNNYIMPPFVSRDGSTVSSIIIMEANVVPANQMVVGDSRFARIYERTGYEMSRGMVGNQFIEDEMTLKIRRRLAFLIKEADAGGWSHVADITADLTELTP